MTQCWQHQPEDRPNFAIILERIEYCTQVLVLVCLEWDGETGFFLRSGLGKPEHEMRRQHCITAVSSPGRLMSAWDIHLIWGLILLLLIGTGLHSFTNSRPVALLLLIKVQIPTSKRAQTGQHPYAVHVSHSIPLFTLTTWSAEQKWSWLRAPFAGGFCSCRQFSESDCAGEGRWGQLC